MTKHIGFPKQFEKAVLRIGSKMQEIGILAEAGNMILWLNTKKHMILNFESNFRPRS